MGTVTRHWGLVASQYDRCKKNMSLGSKCEKLDLKILDPDCPSVGCAGLISTSDSHLGSHSSCHMPPQHTSMRLPVTEIPSPKPFRGAPGALREARVRSEGMEGGKESSEHRRVVWEAIMWHIKLFHRGGLPPQNMPFAALPHKT